MLHEVKTSKACRGLKESMNVVPWGWDSSRLLFKCVASSAWLFHLVYTDCSKGMETGRILKKHLNSCVGTIKLGFNPCCVWELTQLTCVPHSSTPLSESKAGLSRLRFSPLEGLAHLGPAAVGFAGCVSTRWVVLFGHGVSSWAFFTSCLSRMYNLVCKIATENTFKCCYKTLRSYSWDAGCSGKQCESPEANSFFWENKAKWSAW